MHRGIVGCPRAMHGDHARPLRGDLVLIQMAPEGLVFESKGGTPWALGSRAIPHPELEVHGRILRLSANLRGRKVVPKRAQLPVLLGAFVRGVRRCRRC